MRHRLDLELVRRKLARSREDARELIESGAVVVNGIKASKPATQVDEGASITLPQDRTSYVSRGALKLSGALDHFGLKELNARRALDAGASTGGFTEVLLKRGVERVYAVDVGYGQLAWALQNHPQVVVIDRTNVRDLKEADIDGKVDLIVADLSFISLRTVMGALASILEDDGEMFLMVKPQFEVGKESLGAGGVVRDESLRATAIRGVASEAWRLGLGVKGVVASSTPGPAGNVEYFLWLSKGGEELRESDLSRAIVEGPK